MTRKYELTLFGCDDSTDVILTLTNEQKNWLDSIMAKVEEASTSGCMSTMSLERIK